MGRGLLADLLQETFHQNLDVILKNSTKIWVNLKDYNFGRVKGEKGRFRN